MHKIDWKLQKETETYEYYHANLDRQKSMNDSLLRFTIIQVFQILRGHLSNLKPEGNQCEIMFISTINEINQKNGVINRNKQIGLLSTDR